MNNFENIVAECYALEHAKEIAKSTLKTAKEFGGDISDTYASELNKRIIYRVSYIAIQKYHEALSKHFEKQGINLPTFNELFEQ